MAKRPKSRLKIWLEYAIFRCILFTMAITPERLLYPWYRGLSRIMYRLDGRHRNRAIQNLLYSGVAKDQADAERLTKQVFAHAANLLCDIAVMPRHLRKHNVADYVQLVDHTGNLDDILQRDEQGRTRQIIIATAHFGNWELAGNMYVWMCGRKLLSVMRPLDNPLIGNYIYNTRQSSEHRICAKDGALKQLLRAVKDGDSICLVADQHAARFEAVEATFFGKPVNVHASVAGLHLRTGIPLIVSAARRLDDQRHYVLDVVARIEHQPTGDLDADMKAVTQAYMDGLEKLIMLDPTQWLWPHRRFLELRRAEAAAQKSKNATRRTPHEL